MPYSQETVLYEGQGGVPKQENHKTSIGSVWSVRWTEVYRSMYKVVQRGVQG